MKRLFMLGVLSNFLIQFTFLFQVSAMACEGKSRASLGWLPSFIASSNSCIEEKDKESGNWKIILSKSTIQDMKEMVDIHGARGLSEPVIKLNEILEYVTDNPNSEIYFTLPHYNGDCFYYNENQKKFGISFSNNCSTVKGYLASLIYGLFDSYENAANDVGQLIENRSDLFNIENFSPTSGFLKTYVELTDMQTDALPFNNNLLFKHLLKSPTKLTGPNVAFLNNQLLQKTVSQKFPQLNEMSADTSFRIAGLNVAETRSANFARYLGDVAKNNDWGLVDSLPVSSSCIEYSYNETSFYTVSVNTTSLESCSTGEEVNVARHVDAAIISYIESTKPIPLSYGWNNNGGMLAVDWVEQSPLFRDDFILWHIPNNSGVSSYSEVLEKTSSVNFRSWKIGGTKRQISGSQDKTIAHTLSEKHGIEIVYQEFDTADMAIQALIRGDIDLTLSNPVEMFPYVVNVNTNGIEGLVVLSEKENSTFPEIPSSKELGYDDYFYSVTSVFLNSRTTPSRVNGVQQTMENLVNSPEFSRYLERKLLTSVNK